MRASSAQKLGVIEASYASAIIGDHRPRTRHHRALSNGSSGIDRAGRAAMETRDQVLNCLCGGMIAAQGGLTPGQDQVQQLLGLLDVARLEQGLGVEACRLESVGVVEAATALGQLPGLLQQSLGPALLPFCRRARAWSAMAQRVRGCSGPSMRSASAAADS